MANRTIWTPIKKEKFIAALKERGNVSYACKKTKIARQTAYDQKKEDPEFSQEWDRAVSEGIENFAEDLEIEGRRRAVEGVLKPVYQQGKQVGKIREYSDTLLIFLLKGANPSKYHDPKPNDQIKNLSDPEAIALQAYNKLRARGMAAEQARETLLILGFHEQHIPALSNA